MAAGVALTQSAMAWAVRPLVSGCTSITQTCPCHRRMEGMPRSSDMAARGYIWTE